MAKRNKVEFPLRCEERRAPNGKPQEWWFDANDQPVCGSLKRNAKGRDLSPPHDRCTQPPATGRNRCRYHGGSTPRGIVHHQFKHGGYTQIWQGKPHLQEAFSNTLSDPDLLNMAAEIALIKVRLNEIFEVEREEIGELWLALGGELNALDTAIRNGNAEGVVLRMQAALRIWNTGSAEVYRWREAYNVIDLLRKVETAESSRRIKMHEVVRGDLFMVFVMRLGNVLNTAKTLEDAKRGVSSLIDDFLAPA